jgi:hypothetical protein
MSIPTNRFPSCRAATPVDPDPMNGSTITQEMSDEHADPTFVSLLDAVVA